MRPNLLSFRPKQAGVVLLIALIALVVLTLAGIGLVRSVDTGNVIAGNLAFRQATLQTADHGIEAAFIALPAIALATNTNIANQYRATRLDVAVSGATRTVNWFTDIDWASIPCRDNTNSVVASCAGDYKIKYFIDRLCICPGTLSAVTINGTCTVAVTDKLNQCMTDIGTGKTGSKGAFGAQFSSASAVYYRVTVQVTGPRNTTSYVQTIMSIG